MSWPTEIKTRAENITVRLILSTFIGYLTIFALGATRYVA
jgi:hypothetical protein